MKTKMITLCLVLGSWGVFAQHDHAKKGDDKMDQNMVMFKDAKLGIAYANYLTIKDALVASNSNDAKKGATALQKSLKEVSGSTAASEAASKIAASKDLKVQREVFSKLSEEMATLIKGGKLSMGSLYLDYCPMAKSSWLSNEKEIKNPYFGEQMLNCGSVKETIQ